MLDYLLWRVKHIIDVRNTLIKISCQVKTEILLFWVTKLYHARISLSLYTQDKLNARYDYSSHPGSGNFTECHSFYNLEAKLDSTVNEKLSRKPVL